MTTNEETLVGLTCPSCGNDQKFLVKTLQMHLVHIDGENIDTAEEGRPAVLELLCDECEPASPSRSCSCGSSRSPAARASR